MGTVDRWWACGRRIAAALLATATMVVALAAPPAQAVVVDSGTDSWSDSFDLFCDKDRTDGVVEFWHHFEVEASLDYVIRTRADGSWEFFTGRGVENITVTVTEPFQVRFTATRSWLEKDVRVVKGEGDLVTLVVSTNYHITVFQPNGKQDAVNTGRFEGRLVIDTSTGEVISDDFVKSVGHIGAPGSCTSALEFANQ